jgi:hypothetical protein
MGREVKRVPLDFRWDGVWPGYLRNICTEEIRGACNLKSGKVDIVCEKCREFGRLAGLPMSGNCPDSSIPVPTGPGWQLWEDVTEGSPVSPVFATAEELATWLSTPGNDTSSTRGTSYESWLKFLTGTGWAPSMVMTSSGIVSGVQFAAGQED